MESFVHKFFCYYDINERCTVLAYKIRRICKLVAQTILSDAFNNMYTIYDIFTLCNISCNIIKN